MVYVLAFAGGLLAIVSPCILPVLPFVFARADQPFRRSGLPLLAGMAVTFAAVGTLATAAGSWIVRANQFGRVMAMALFAVLGVALLFPALADYLSRPFVRIGAVVERRGGRQSTVAGSFLLGISTGFLWTPCAGPILGLILAGAAVGGAGVRSVGLLLAFAAGSACALAAALTAGHRVFAMMKRTLGADVWIRRGLGVAVLAGVIAIASGWDTGVLTRVSLTGGISATPLEQRLVDRIRPAAAAPGAKPSPGGTLGREGSLPALDGAVEWLNGPAQTRDGLRGRVVLIDFWTYSCINCLRALPYVEAWARKYKDSGLTVIGVHSPEFAFERDTANVANAVRNLKLTYPIAIDSNRVIWNAFNNEYWPAHYFVDAEGSVRFHHFGEGEYDTSERVIQQLLAEKNAGRPPAGLVRVAGTGVQAAAEYENAQSPETYIGYDRQEHFASPERIARDRVSRYSAPIRPRVNQWGLDGHWTVADENAVLSSAPGRMVFRFHGRDLHLVLGPPPDGKAVRFRVTLDGAPPAGDHGIDVDGQGNGTVSEYRLYQLIRQNGAARDRTFEIEFLDPGVQAFAFTFG